MFEGRMEKRTLAEMFAGRKPVVVYPFMFAAEGKGNGRMFVRLGGC